MSGQTHIAENKDQSSVIWDFLGLNGTIWEGLDRRSPISALPSGSGPAMSAHLSAPGVLTDAIREFAPRTR
jgi:hypothetical protein